MPSGNRYQRAPDGTLHPEVLDQDTGTPNAHFKGPNTNADPFEGFNPQDVNRARAIFNGNVPQMMNYLVQNAQKNQELANQLAVSRGRGVEAAGVRVTAPPRPGSDTAEAKNARAQLNADRLAQQNYNKEVAALLGKTNPATGINYTPQEATQAVEALGMKRPTPPAGIVNPTTVAPPQVLSPSAQGVAPSAGGQAPPAPVTGRAPVKANQADVRQDAEGNLWTKDARGQVVPYQPQNQ